jgi:hypothetical protein
VVMTAQKAQADVLLHRLHYALPGWDAAAERRDAQDELHSAAQARAWADGDFGADHGAGRAAQSGRRRRIKRRAPPRVFFGERMAAQQKRFKREGPQDLQ